MTIPTATAGASAAPGPSTAGSPAELVRRAQDVAECAAAVATAAGSPGAAAGIAAALAHIETALESLERATGDMEGLARPRLSRATVLLGEPWSRVLVDRTTHDFEDLTRALANARRACEKARRGAGPILAELTVV